MRLLILIVFLTGCGVDKSVEPIEPRPRPVWDGSYDIITSGIYIKAQSPVIFGALVESELMRVRDCTGIYKPLKKLVVEHSLEPDELGGFAWWDADYSYIRVWDLNLVGHELIHILLYLNGVPSNDNTNHKHPAFFKCHDHSVSVNWGGVYG